MLFSSSEDVKIGSLSAKASGVERIVFRRGLAVPIKAKRLNIHIFKNVLTHIFANSEETKRTILKHLHPYLDADKIGVVYNGIKKELAVPYEGACAAPAASRCARPLPDRSRPHDLG